MSFTKSYSKILKDVYEIPDHISRPRDLEVRESLCYRFVLNNPLDRLPYLTGRNYSICYFVAESLWYLAGLDSTEWISAYSSFWKKISDDGVTANSAYGSRIFKSHPYINPTDDSETQWDYVLNELTRDGDSRRAVIHVRSPFDSYRAHLDVPCTLSLQFFLRSDAVHLSVSMRSSDAILGIGNDIPAFTLFQELMALDLTQRLGRKIDVGRYYHVSNSMHIYERDYALVKGIISNPELGDTKTWIMPPMPSRPPLEKLLEFESVIRSQTNVQNILGHLKAEANSVEPYWYDWMIILSAYWCGKLGDTIVKEELLQSTSFEGYRYFKR